MKRFALLVFVAFFLLPLPLAGADEIRLKGGTTIHGVVLRQSGVAVDLLLPAGDTLTFRRADIAKVVQDDEEAATGTFTRYVEPTEDKPGGLDVAITYYVKKGAPRVDLVGAVHIADRSFYREVQKVLEDAGTVLFEGVKPKGTSNAEFDRGPPPDKPKSAIRELQERMARWLGLAFQLDGITYRRPHFVHADVTTDELEGEDDETKEQVKESSRSGIFAQARFMNGLLKLAGPLFDLLLGRGKSAGPLRSGLKESMAEMLGTMDMEERIRRSDPERVAWILDHRNEVAIKRLKEQLEQKAKGPIAIFYGAAHMPGLEKALVEEMGYTRAGARWLRAWRVER
ncbi:MAG: hypothetical protein QNJ90_14285 [Planctomycetota bacterium]|nr:hypothetical protein [Planctomycetota bacterium]